jgi:hypothetical protein
MSGTIVESTFTSIAVVSTALGLLPVSLPITQRFEAIRKVDRSARLLVVHGDTTS